MYYVIVTVILLLLIFLLPGCSVNGRPMRFSPDANQPKAKSWYIEGAGANDVSFSCSFVEFDERGDYLNFDQHKHCQAKIKELNKLGRVLLVIYCHGWKNSSQSRDVTEFNAFLSKLAQSDEIRERGLRVHGVYLGWRGNAFAPYVEKTRKKDSYADNLDTFGEAIVDKTYHRRTRWSGFIPENLSYWNRKRAAEHKVSGIPIARSIFTYAAAAKDYGRRMDNRVFVLGHSFGALMLEQSLGHAMIGAVTMEWWERDKAVVSRDAAEASREIKAKQKPALPFDMVLFVNSAAPAIYAKEMRDFLKADRSATSKDAPVIVSLTSTADKATGMMHPLGNLAAPVSPSLQRRYTTGVFGDRQSNGTYPAHSPIRQSAFYEKTPGHHPYLINHWIVKDESAPLPSDTSHATVFTANLSTNTNNPDRFYTSQAKHPAAAWRITTENPGDEELLDGMKPSMRESNYWIVSCGKELIGGHNDIWSVTTMEMYVALYRAVEARRNRDVE